MEVRVDRKPRLGWALQHVSSGLISTCTLVDSEKEATALLVGFEKHLPHKGKHRVVPVMVTLEKA